MVSKKGQQMVDIIIYFIGISIIITSFVMGLTGELKFIKSTNMSILGMLVIIYAHMRGQNNK